jgi:hypothetical protein
VNEKSEVPAEVIEAGDVRFIKRLNRLNDLVRLNAPTIVVAQEVLNLQDALWLAHPEWMSAAIEQRATSRVRKAAGFCQMPKCGRRAVTDLELCTECEKEFQRESREIETVADAES